MLLLYLHPLPRPFSYRVQLRSDARAYKPWLLWLASGGLIVWGAYSLLQPHPDGLAAFGWLKIEAGFAVLLFWLYGVVTVVRWTRTAPLEVGLIRSVKPVFPFPDWVAAEATQADGAVIEVTMRRAVVDAFLKEHGECEVLYCRRRHRGDTRDTGFAFAARQRLEPSGPPGRADHWTSLPAAQRLQLQEIARTTHYPVDVVFFVLSALSAATQRKRQAGPAGDAPLASTRELVQFIPAHASRLFGVRAATILSAMGLRTGDDIGAIVAGCVGAGRLSYSPGESADDFRGIDLLAALTER
jgi:uncharacterized repeat protein (TIGR04138 family)